MSGAGLPRSIVVMGVSGSGKTTVAGMLAERLGGVFVDADDLHSAEAIQKMGRGTPLTDEDRWPWLSRVATRMRHGHDAGETVVVACSALRRGYRDHLRSEAGHRMHFVHLDGDVETLSARLSARGGHFMPRSLLESQLQTLEGLAADEEGVRVGVTSTSAEIVDQIVDALAPLTGGDS